MKLVIEIEPERCTSVTRFCQHVLEVIGKMLRPSTKNNFRDVGCDDGVVHDINGNKIGTWKLEEE